MSESERTVPGRNGGTLRPWKKGQTGNPAGHSKARRNRAYLNVLTAEALAQTIDADLAKTFLEQYSIEIPEDLIGTITVGEILAGGIVQRAVAGHTKSIEHVIALTPSKVELSGEVDTGKPRSGEFVPVKDEADPAVIEVLDEIVH